MLPNQGHRAVHYLNDIVFSIFAVDSFDSTNIKTSKHFRTGIHPQSVPLCHCNLFQHCRTCVCLPVSRDRCPHVSFVIVANFLDSDVILGVDEWLRGGVGLCHGYDAGYVTEVILVLNFDLPHSGVSMSQLHHYREIRSREHLLMAWEESLLHERELLGTQRVEDFNELRKHPWFAAEVVDRVEGVDCVDATVLETNDEAAEVLS